MSHGVQDSKAQSLPESKPIPTSAQIPEPDERWDRFIACLLDGRSIKASLRLADLQWARVAKWMANYPTRESEYARAREASADLWADKAVRHADLATPETVHVQRLRSDVSKWRAAVQAPRKWSEKQGDTTVNVNLSLNSVHLSMLRHREPTAGLVEVEQVAQLPSSDPNSSDTSRG